MSNLTDLPVITVDHHLLLQTESSLQGTDHLLQLWITSLLASILVGMAGIVPLAFISFTLECVESKKSDANKRLKLMLSFAVGALLGDTFLHLLPEAWGQFSKHSTNVANTHLQLGCLVLLGMTTFIALQMVFAITGKLENDVEPKDRTHIIGYLNLFANGIDNFTHGLAVAASFIVGNKIGVLTTLAIVLHEIPHEFADFAIYIRSGFSKWSAIRAQMLTTSIGLFGTVFALQTQNFRIQGHQSHPLHAYVLPFTAGCFLHIALSSILPEIVREENSKESLKQLLWIVLGVLVMGLVNYFAD